MDSTTIPTPQLSRNRSRWSDQHVRPLRHVFCALLLALVVVGCGGARSHAIKITRDIGALKLRADLQTLVDSPAGNQHEIPQAAWPESVRRFQPLAVQLHMTGVLIVLSRAGREQEGLLVMLNPRDDPDAGGSGAGYEVLGDGLF